MARDAADNHPAQQIWVRQCTDCGRADLREWFESPQAVSADDWECQLCERNGWRPRDLRGMLEGRMLDISPR